MTTYAKNKAANYNYHLEKPIEAGLSLTGSEVKAIKNGQCNLKESYVQVRNGEAFLVNAHISQSVHSPFDEHQPTRPRKLLLHKREIKKLAEEVQLASYTIVPIAVYDKDNKLKLSIALAKGKKNYDKRQSIKERDLSRQLKKGDY